MWDILRPMPNMLYLQVSQRVEKTPVFETLSEKRMCGKEKNNNNNKKRKKSSPPVFVTPLGIKKLLGESLKRLWGWNRWNRKAKECSFSCHLLCPLLLPPFLHHLASGVWTTALDGGASVLSVLSMRLWVYYRLSLPWRSPAASHFSEFHKHRNTSAHANTQALCNIWTLFTLLPLIFLCGALCRCCAWAWWGEQGEQSRA